MNEQKRCCLTFYGLNTLNQIISKSIKLNDLDTLLIKLENNRGSTLDFSTGNEGYFGFLLLSKFLSPKLECEVSKLLQGRT